MTKSKLKNWWQAPRWSPICPKTAPENVLKSLTIIILKSIWLIFACVFALLLNLFFPSVTSYKVKSSNQADDKHMIYWWQRCRRTCFSCFSWNTPWLIIMEAPLSLDRKGCPQRFQGNCSHSDKIFDSVIQNGEYFSSL